MAATTAVGTCGDADFWLDIAEFESRIQSALPRQPAGLAAEDIAPVEAALKLYRGDLLEGIFDEWTLREREHLRTLYQRGLAYIAAYYRAHGDYGSSLEYAHKILDVEPLREEIHREIMRLYALNGQRALGVRQYELCRERLRVDLGIEPMEETRALCEQIRMGEVITSHAPRSAPPETLQVGAGIQALVEQIQMAARELEQAHLRLQEALQRIGKLEG